LPWLTALENVQLGVDRVYPHITRKERRELAAHHLTLVGLGSSIDRRATELSQGMQQRVGIARAFAISPKMLLLDEPFGMLDSLTRMDLQDVLTELLGRDRKTTLMVTHDVDEALLMADRVVMMTSGPAATIGEIVEVPFARPRNRTAVLNHPEYYELRERLIGFLEGQSHSPVPAEKETPQKATTVRIDTAQAEPTYDHLDEPAQIVRRA
jgi:ABC-type nitrate/sulfonate/bicarbonate transport system ATPase subunit